MSANPSFGRRGLSDKPSARPASSPSAPGVELTPEQRAYLFGAKTDSQADAAVPTASGEVPPWSRRAAFAACFAAACFVLAFTAFAPTPDVAASADVEAAKKLLGGGARWLQPAALLWGIVSVSSQFAGTLWLTNKFCTLMRFGGLPAFAFAGAWIAAGLAFLTELVGLGAPDMSFLLLVGSGAGAAAFYRLLAGRAARSP